jgi:hypothetical protein
MFCGAAEGMKCSDGPADDGTGEQKSLVHPNSVKGSAGKVKEVHALLVKTAFRIFKSNKLQAPRAVVTAACVIMLQSLHSVWCVV